MTNQRKTYLLGTLGIVVFAGLLWWGQHHQLKQKETIKIGVIASLTGPGSFYGQNIRKGVELAVHEINAAGGVGGKQLEAVYEDDATDPKQTVSAAQKLIDVDGVLAIVGVQWDFLANAVVPIANEKHEVMISAAAPFDSLLQENQNSPYFFTTFPSASGAIDAVKQFLAREAVKNIVILVTNNDWGTAHAHAYETAARESGVTVLQIMYLPQTDGNDLRTPLAQIKQLKPGAILTAVNDADNISFAMRYHELGLTARILNHENFSDPIYTGRLGRSSALNFYFFKYLDPTAQFTESFTAFYGQKPQLAADTAYDAVYVLKQVMERGGISREKIAAAMKTVREFHGSSGLIDFTTSNFPKDKKATLWQITTSGVVEVK